MKPFPISVQLYSVRDEAAKDFTGVLKKIAGMGYVGVEPAGLHGMTPQEVRTVLDDLGLVCSSTHGGMPTEDNVNEIVETAGALGYKRHVSGFGSDWFKDKESTLRAAASVQKAAELLKPHGLSFGMHNHWFEFDKKFDGKYPHQVLMDAAPDAFAQIDTYWTFVGGADPARVVREYGARAPLLHVKDGPGKTGEPMTAVGAGVMNWADVIGAAADTTEWLIVELDACATDMMTAVAESYDYLVSNGFARGNK